MKNNKIKWLCKTSLMIALLIVLQTVTKAFGQIVTGSCVNTVLAVSVLIVGLSCGITVALLSPFFAFLLGIGPQLFPIIPAIAAGNCVFVFALYLICKKDFYIIRSAAACAVSSFAKFLTLNLLIVQLLCPLLELPEKQVNMLSTMFSWPQLITALIGSAIALILVPRIKFLIK